MLARLLYGHPKTTYRPHIVRKVQGQSITPVSRRGRHAVAVRPHLSEDKVEGDVLLRCRWLGLRKSLDASLREVWWRYPANATREWVLGTRGLWCRCSREGCARKKQTNGYGQMSWCSHFQVLVSMPACGILKDMSALPMCTSLRKLKVSP